MVSLYRVLRNLHCKLLVSNMNLVLLVGKKWTNSCRQIGNHDIIDVNVQKTKKQKTPTTLQAHKDKYL